MTLLLDTHVLIWAATDSPRLPAETIALLNDDQNQLFFSVVSFWEISIKRSLGRRDIHVAPRQLRRQALDAGYRELEVTSEHAFTVESLPMLHRDPFDRMLIAQAMAEGMTLLTGDGAVARYAGPIMKI